MSLVKLVLSENTSVEEAIRLLDRSGIGVVPVVDDKNLLIGIITDGDVRRAVISGKIDIDHVINRNPRKLPEGTSRLEIIRQLKSLHLRHMPVVDVHGRLVDVVCVENFLVERKRNHVVIMAGGLGSRLGDLTRMTPKPMLPVAGKPILERIVDDLKIQGFHDFTFCLNYKADVIRDHFGNGENLGVRISYTFEEKRLGTAGALTLLDRKKIDHPLLVMNGDVLSKVDYEDLMQFHTQSQSQATMSVRPQNFEVPFACVSFDEGSNLIELTEKPKIQSFINSGIYVLNPEVLDHLPASEFYDMPTLFQDMMAKGLKVKAYQFQDFWIDIGMPEDYMRMRDHNFFLQS